MMAAAQTAAARGLPIFPVGRDKQPLTRNGLLDATSDPEQIRAWWTKFPQANIGLRTGKPSGTVVLDIDGQAGADNLAALEASYLPLPPTTSTTTPRGGQHYYFLHPGTEVRNSAGQLAQGIDIRGDGGYVLMPPSIGANGRPYAWDSEARRVHLPDWLRALIARTGTLGSRQPAHPSVWVDMVSHGLQNGQRNTGLTRLVGHLLAKDVDVYLVLAVAELVNQRCKPPLAPQEIRQIVESIAGREVRKRKT